MKQNKDREEFERINICGCSKICFGHKETQDKLWSWIKTYTQKKVEEALNNILEENHCDLDGTYDYDGIAESVIKLAKNK